MNKTTQFIAVHGGAGDHPPERDQVVRRAMRRACANALTSNPNLAELALDSVQRAVCELEDDPAVNAGYGAASAFGSIGAVQGIRNPVLAARVVLEYSQRPKRLGRVAPLTLVGSGARSFAARNGVPVLRETSFDDLISPDARDLWSQWSARLQSAEEGSDSLPLGTGNALQDTVGATAICGETAAAGVSSGGILLKLPGRMGEAAVYGAGCWASNDFTCSVSGTGEDIVCSALARTLCEDIRQRGTDSTHEALEEVLQHKFIDPAIARGEPEPSVGAILLIRERDDEAQSVRLWVAFTTPSMAIGYVTSFMPKPKTMILRRPALSETTATRTPVYISAFSLGS